MSNRSKILLVILIVLVLVIFSSFLGERPATNESLSEWEEEIQNPDNSLDPLNEKVGNDVFVIDVAKKVENIIDKFFSFVIGIVEGFIDKIFVFICC